jgi:hypothetical protein
MSLVALKRKATTTVKRGTNVYPSDKKISQPGVNKKVLSGQSPESLLVVRGPSQDVPIVSGGGFSINGKYRNVGGVGITSLISKRGPTMKGGTIDWKGNGGKYGSYKNGNMKPTNNYCSETYGSKPSTLNTKGMLSTKYKWKQSSIPDDVFTKEGKEPPKNGQLKEIYNHWVSNDSNGYNELHTAGQYTKKLATVLTYKNRNIPKSEVCTRYCTEDSHTFGKRYRCNIPVSKFNEYVGSSDRAISGAIANRASLFPEGYNKPWPTMSSSSECNNNAKQVYDPVVLNNYYKDGNKNSVYCDREKPEICKEYKTIVIKRPQPDPTAPTDATDPTTTTDATAPTTTTDTTTTTDATDATDP